MEKYIKQYRYALVDDIPTREETHYIAAGEGGNDINDTRNYTASELGLDNTIDGDTILFKYIIINNFADDSQQDLPEWFGNHNDLVLKSEVKIISEVEYTTLVNDEASKLELAKQDAVEKIISGGIQ